MADRFERLFELPSNLYSAGSPVIINAGALLKDNQTGNIIVQLKYQSVSTAPIKALRVDISAYDITGFRIPGKENYQYLDLSVRNGQFFGSNKAIVLPDPTARSFSIDRLDVVLGDGRVDSVHLPLAKLPESKLLRAVLHDVELAEQYKIEVCPAALYEPQENEELWQCACGTWNSIGKCSGCNSDRNLVWSALDISSLVGAKNIRMEKEKAENDLHTKLDQEAEEKKSKIVKCLMVALGILLLILGLLFLLKGAIPNFTSDGLTIRVLCIFLWNIATVMLGTHWLINTKRCTKVIMFETFDIIVGIIGIVSFVFFYCLTYIR